MNLSLSTRFWICAFLSFLVVLIFFGGRFFPHRTDGELAVTFLDVGQGDATFIESPQGFQILVDGGPNESVLRSLGSEMSFFDRSLDMIVATHPDQDHIGGLVSILKRYKVRTIVMTENKNDTPVADIFEKLVRDEGAEIIYARSGQVYDFGIGRAGSTTLRIFFPDRDPSSLESNTSSIVAKLSYGKIGFMLTGDAPKAIEEHLVELYGTSLESEILKVGHHGSRTSSTHTFVEMVRPLYAVISSGKDNKYGHPHEEVIEEFEVMKTETKNTADLGSIHFLSNGEKVWLK